MADVLCHQHAHPRPQPARALRCPPAHRLQTLQVSQGPCVARVTRPRGAGEQASSREWGVERGRTTAAAALPGSGGDSCTSDSDSDGAALATGPLLVAALLLLWAWPAAAAPGEAPPPHLLDPGEHHHHLTNALGLLAGEAVGALPQEDFWSNVGRYISYFFSVLLGTAYTAARPIGNALKRPGTAVAVLAGIGLLVAFVTFTVRSMLGLQDIGLQNAGGIS